MSEIKPVSTGQPEIAPVKAKKTPSKGKKVVGSEGLAIKDKFVKSKAGSLASEIPLKTLGFGGNEPLSFNRINTPLAALATPILDSGILTALKATALNNMNLQVNGSIRQGSAYFPVNLSFIQRIPYQAGQPEQADKVNYDIHGFLGNEPVNLSAQYSDTRLMVNGHIGQNQVWLRGYYAQNINTLDASGNIGQVPVNVHTSLGDKLYMRGMLGNESLSQDIIFSGKDTHTNGFLGNAFINGYTRQNGYVNEDVPESFSVYNRIKDVDINYNIDCRGVK